MSIKYDPVYADPTYAHYCHVLDQWIDEIYNRADDMGWSWPKLASEAMVSYVTVWRLGTYTTRLPRMQTLVKLGRAVGLKFILINKKDSVRLLKQAG